MGGHNYDPFDCLQEYDRSREVRKELSDAIDFKGKESNAEYGEDIQKQEEDEKSILQFDKQKEEGVREVARVEKPSKPPKKRRRLGVREITSKRWLREHNLKEATL